VEGQIEGAVAQGMGYGLTEEIVTKGGVVMNSEFLNYLIPSAFDMPKIHPIIVEVIDPKGPFGAKGMGEPGLIPVAPAIANAIYNAIGVTINDLPITPEKILQALEKKGGKPC
jgi:xanthine dehydrogenase molybdenum-binding subunit